VGEDDVDREEDRVHERERDTERIARQLDVGQEVDAGHREPERDAVAGAPRAERRERDDREELDRRHRAEWHAVDRRVEAAVHQRQHGTPAEQQAACLAAEPGPGAPRPAPQGEDHRRRGDPQPGHSEHVEPREQQYRERRAEVVEDGADDEVQLGSRLTPPGGGVEDHRRQMIDGKRGCVQGRMQASCGVCL
jgi:hypothetical protein